MPFQEPTLLGAKATRTRRKQRLRVQRPCSTAQGPMGSPAHLAQRGDEEPGAKDGKAAHVGHAVDLEARWVVHLPPHAPPPPLSIPLWQENRAGERPRCAGDLSERPSGAAGTRRAGAAAAGGSADSASKIGGSRARLLHEEEAGAGGDGRERKHQQRHPFVRLAARPALVHRRKACARARGAPAGSAAAQLRSAAAHSQPAGAAAQSEPARRTHRAFRPGRPRPEKQPSHMCVCADALKVSSSLRVPRRAACTTGAAASVRRMGSGMRSAA